MSLLGQNKAKKTDNGITQCTCLITCCNGISNLISCLNWQKTTEKKTRNHSGGETNNLSSPELEKNKEMTTVIWQVLNLFTSTPSNENLHRPSQQMLLVIARRCRFKMKNLHIRHFWMKCKYAAAIDDKKENKQKIQSTGLEHLQSSTCLCWVKSKKWPIYRICPNWGWITERLSSFSQFQSKVCGCVTCAWK